MLADRKRTNLVYIESKERQTIRKLVQFILTHRKGRGKEKKMLMFIFILKYKQTRIKLVIFVFILVIKTDGHVIQQTKSTQVPTAPQ